MDNAIIWLRVSTKDQDEANQLPECLRHCSAKAYNVVRTYTVHGESAYHGAQDPDWAKVVRDIEDGVATKIVIWKVDRLDRRNILVAIPMVNKALAAGATVEFASQAFIDLTTMPGRIAFAIFCEMAHEESKLKSDRVKIKMQGNRDRGSVNGRPPWGMEIVPLDGRKVLVPTATGRKWLPAIYAHVIDGWSLRDIAEWLTNEGVPTTMGKPWHEAYLRQRIIMNPVYYGNRRGEGSVSSVEQPPISPTVWKEANAALASRLKPGRGAQDKALLSPVCGNPDCDATGDHPSPMYRIKFGKLETHVAYRCTGRGPQRRGCGNMVSLHFADSMVTAFMVTTEGMHSERRFIAGDDQADQIQKLRLALDKASTRDESNALWDQIEALEANPGQPASWQTVETDLPESVYFYGLDDDARRKYLTERYVISLSRGEDGTPVVHVDTRS